MSKKIDLWVVVLIVVLIFVIQNVLNEDEPVEDVTLIIPSKVGEVKTKVDSTYVRDTVWIQTFIPGKVLPQEIKIIVDSLYKKRYEDAISINDTLTAKNLFLQSIALDTFEGTLIDNKDIKIDGRFLTRGTLLEYDVNYKIKKDSITYTPEIRYRHPKLSLVTGLGIGVPTNTIMGTQPTLYLHVGLQNKKGSILSAGFDTEGRVMIGYSRSFRLFK